MIPAYCDPTSSWHSAWSQDVANVAERSGVSHRYVVALPAVQRLDFTSADRAPLAHQLLSKVSSRIINEVKGINRVVYDVSTKPPATIEWE